MPRRRVSLISYLIMRPVTNDITRGVFKSRWLWYFCFKLTSSCSESIVFIHTWGDLRVLLVYPELLVLFMFVGPVEVVIQRKQRMIPAD